jgi:CelD/BcsL family acetyltransferase involved in cellulose biosynthesis
MLKFETISRLDQLEAVREDWARLRSNNHFECYSHPQYVAAVGQDPSVLAPLVVIVKENDRVKAILPFAVFSIPKRFKVGEIRLLSIMHRVLHRVGFMVGELSEAQSADLIRHMEENYDFDAINFYELPADHPISVTAPREVKKFKLGPSVRDSFPHWLTDFPDSFESYLADFKSKTRNSLKRKLAKFRKAYDLRLEIVTDREQIPRFLEVGEAISRQTYQWDLGVRLINDKKTLFDFTTNAEQGELRCYLLYADDRPVAFMRGTLVNHTFFYGTPGFLREYAKWSAGSVMLMLVFQDLIENSECRCFDFGMGGDYSGYKAQFGNRNYDAVLLDLYSCKTLKSNFIYYADWIFWYLKRFLRKVISPESKVKIKGLLRKLGLMK